jgi:hypothetical protein
MASFLSRPGIKEGGGYNLASGCLQFGSFVGVGMCGRLVRFGLLVFIPQLAIRLFRCENGRDTQTATSRL